MTDETELEKVERLVRETEASVSHQRDIVGILHRNGVTSRRAARLLAEFEAKLEQRRKRLSELRANTLPKCASQPGARR